MKAISNVYTLIRYRFAENIDMRILLLIGFIGFFCTNQSRGQQINGRYSVGAHFGTTVFFGDVKTNEFAPSISNPSELRFGSGVQLTYAISPYLSLRYHWLRAGLSGTNIAANEKFNASLNDHGIQALVNMTTLFFYDEDRAQIEIWGILGYGLNSFRTLRTTYNTNSFLSSFGYENQGANKSKPTTELSIPLGFSLRTRLNKFSKYYSNNDLDKIEIMFDAMLFLVNTDKLDAKETGVGKDRYSYFSLGTTYYFGY